MLWFYDLVIIGDSLAAVRGAIQAALHRRVALVMGNRHRLELDFLEQSLATFSPSQPPGPLSWLQGQYQRWQDTFSSAALAQAGVDVIQGQGRLSQSDKGRGLELIIGEDRLRARHFLLVDRPEVVHYQNQEITVATLLQELGRHPPPCIFVPGQHLQDLVWVQLGLALGIPVAWGGDVAQLLAQDDPALRDWFKADLVNTGIQLSPGQESLAPVTPTLTTIIRPIRESLEGLESLGIMGQEGQMMVNSYLHTTQPHLWASGSCLKGYGLGMISQAEVNYVLSTLLLPGNRQPFCYKTLPWWLATPTPIARVGWSAVAAETAYRGKITVLPIQPTHFQTGQGQLVLDRHERLLGATFWGDSAITAAKTLGLGLEHQQVGACLTAAGWEVAMHPRQCGSS